MRKIKYIKRDSAESMIKNEGFHLVVNYVSASFQDIYVYYKRVKNYYYVIMHEQTDDKLGNCRIYCDLDGLLELMRDSGADWDKLLNMAIEDGDAELENALKS